VKKKQFTFLFILNAAGASFAFPASETKYPLFHLQKLNYPITPSANFN